MIRHALSQWPLRRWIAVVSLTPLWAAIFVRTAVPSLGDASVGWLLLSGLAAILSAGILGSYVPKEGYRPDLGCAPCALMPLVTVVGATIAMSTYGPALVGPALAVALTLFGLTQRFSNVDACDVPADRARDGAPGPG